MWARVWLILIIMVLEIYQLTFSSGFAHSIEKTQKNTEEKMLATHMREHPDLAPKQPSKQIWMNNQKNNNDGNSSSRNPVMVDSNYPGDRLEMNGMGVMQPEMSYDMEAQNQFRRDNDWQGRYGYGQAITSEKNNDPVVTPDLQSRTNYADNIGDSSIQKSHIMSQLPVVGHHDHNNEGLVFDELEIEQSYAFHYE